MLFSNLAQWLSWLENRASTLTKFDLSRIQTVASYLKLSKPAPYVITVGGTNGKGSSVALLEMLFKTGAKQVGTYTSPHLIHFNERIKIKGQPVPDELIYKAFEFIAAKRENIELSYFEFATLAALLIFQQQDLDVVVLEVGLGGRLDAVNIIDADLAIITGIDFDHTEILGKTREAIGFEKAGIMRNNKPVVFGDADIPASVLAYAEQLQAPIYCLGRDYHYQASNNRWQWQSSQQQLAGLPIPKIPIQNAATVLQAHALLPPVLQTAPSKLIECLDKVQLAGRFQPLHFANQALVILDVAHNPQSCTYLAAKLQQQPCQGKTYGLVSMLADKAICASLKPLLPIIEAWMATGLEGPRGLTAQQMAEQLKHLGITHCQSQPTVEQAYQQLIAQASVHDRIVIFGSFHTVGRVLALLAGSEL